MATIKAGYLVEHPNGYEGRRIPEQARRLTPWLNAHLTDCRPDNPPVEVPEGIIVTVTGKSIS